MSMSVYLAGAIERAPDFGRVWREDFETWASNHDVVCVNPCKNEHNLISDAGLEDEADFLDLQHTNPPRFKEVMQGIIDYDLDIVDEVDAIVVYYNEFVPAGAGSQGEITYAYRTGKPVYLVQAIEKLPGWIVGCTTKIFDTIEDLQNYLIQDK